MSLIHFSFEIMWILLKKTEFKSAIPCLIIHVESHPACGGEFG